MDELCWNYTIMIHVFFHFLLQIRSFLTGSFGDGFGDSNSTRWHNRHPGAQGTPITLSCPNTTVKPTCRSPSFITSSLSPSPSPTEARSVHSPIPTPSCPDFFRYIHEDLKPWSVSGITKEMVESARQHANVNFRLAIIGGRVYLEQYSRAFQTRDVFTIWGILQLVNRYPGRVPDLEIMFNCDDPPAIKADNFRSSPPPPLFRYCKDGTTLDIVFPDWSFWGW
jgi:Glycosyl transferase family 90